MRKPIRSASGVAVITLLTKPYPCPGRCIFCPTETRMPKSYLSLEPAAQRSLLLNFNPFLTSLLRLFVLKDNGHSVNKAEIIINGGTWSYYPKKYRTYYIKGVFVALNLFNPKTFTSLKQLRKKGKDFRELIGNTKLFQQIFKTTLRYELNKPLEKLQKENTNAYSRAVGISIEERPDTINWRTLTQARIYGVTKIQVGFQHMDDEILLANQRDHTRADNIHAAELLRANAFKINAHFMTNLYKATPAKDLEAYIDFIKRIQPDELKIYPTVLFKNTKLYDIYKKGNYKQYDEETLIQLIIKMKLQTPRWVRINRIFRDIPATYMQGIKIKSNLREIVQKRMSSQGLKCACIRCRQIKQINTPIKKSKIQYQKYEYHSRIGLNIFLEATYEEKLLGFLRLFLPNKAGEKLQLSPIKGHALIREVHVYSKPLYFGHQTQDSVQHLGIGKNLINWAEKIAHDQDYRDISVIAGIGTQNYYKKLGYNLSELNYMHKHLHS